MFGTVLRTPVLFFDNNPSGNLLHFKLVSRIFIEPLVCSYIYIYIGRILNRFSKDVGFVDDVIPEIFFLYLTV